MSKKQARPFTRRVTIMRKNYAVSGQPANAVQLVVQQESSRVGQVPDDKVEFDHYEVLGALRTASQEEIKRCYKSRLLLTHPDKGGSEEAFCRVMTAFEVLGCEMTRAIYDTQVQSNDKSSGRCRSTNVLEEDLQQIIRYILKLCLASVSVLDCHRT